MLGIHEDLVFTKKISIFYSSYYSSYNSSYKPGFSRDIKICQLYSTCIIMVLTYIVSLLAKKDFSIPVIIYLWSVSIGFSTSCLYFSWKYWMNFRVTKVARRPPHCWHAVPEVPIHVFCQIALCFHWLKDRQVWVHPPWATVPRLDYHLARKHPICNTAMNLNLGT